MLESCDVLVIFPVYGQFGAIWKLNSGDAESVKLTFALRASLYLTKSENRTKKSITQVSHYCFE